MIRPKSPNIETIPYEASECKPASKVSDFYIMNLNDRRKESIFGLKHVTVKKQGQKVDSSNNKTVKDAVQFLKNNGYHPSQITMSPEFTAGTSLVTLQDLINQLKVRGMNPSNFFLPSIFEWRLSEKARRAHSR